MEFDSKLFNKFITENQSKVMNYLRSHFNAIRPEDLDDIFQDSSIALFINLLEGKHQGEKESLSHYFFSICHNQANKFIRDKKQIDSLDEGGVVATDDEGFPQNDTPYDLDKIDQLLGLFDEDEEDKDAICERVREIVKNLPDPCDKLLWDFYERGFTMKQIAEMYQYRNEDVAKTTKNRCMKKFEKNFKG